MKASGIKTVLISLLVIVAILTLRAASSPSAVFVERPRRYTVGVVLLSYKRPHNLSKSLPVLASYSIVDEIVVSHGHPDFIDDSFRHPKVRHIVDTQNNDRYGGARRYFNARDHAKADFILFLDDDILPTECTIAEMYNTLLESKNTLVGPIARRCDADGYSNSWLSSNNNVVLIGLSMCRRSLMEAYMKEGFPKFESWLVQHRGNCEDLSLNAFLLQKGMQPVITTDRGYRELDSGEGYSAQSEHYEVRSSFCQMHFA